MGFIKWLYRKYKEYELEQAFSSLQPNEEEKNKEFMRNYAKCVELGFSQEALIALMNLLSSM